MAALADLPDDVAELKAIIAVMADRNDRLERLLLAFAYCYAPGRGGEHAEALLSGFAGILQVDGYQGYNRLVGVERDEGPVQLAYCWAHARRKLHEIAKGGAAPIAEEGLRRIAELYRIEAVIRGQTPEERLPAGQPLINCGAIRIG